MHRNSSYLCLSPDFCGYFSYWHKMQYRSLRLFLNLKEQLYDTSSNSLLFRKSWNWPCGYSKTIQLKDVFTLLCDRKRSLRKYRQCCLNQISQRKEKNYLSRDSKSLITRKIFYFWKNGNIISSPNRFNSLPCQCCVSTFKNEIVNVP